MASTGCARGLDNLGDGQAAKVGYESAGSGEVIAA